MAAVAADEEQGFSEAASAVAEVSGDSSDKKKKAKKKKKKKKKKEKTSAQKRLIRDLKFLMGEDKPDGINAAPIENNIFKWQAVIFG